MKQSTAVTPTVSVIIPCYNGERFIGQAIESALSQTVRDIEVIVCDDGSTDASRGVVESFSGDDRLVYLEHKDNTGIASCRNRGIKHSRAHFLAFLDQDDVWKPDKLELQLAVFERDTEEKVGLVFSNTEVIQEGKDTPPRLGHKVPRQINDMSRIDVMKALYLYNFVALVTTLIRRECFDKLGLLDEDISSGADDYEFCLRLAPVYKFKHIPLPLAIRREHDMNYTNPELLTPDALEITEKLAVLHPELRHLQKKRRSNLLYKLARDLHAKGERDRAKTIYKDAIRVNPQYLKPAFGLLFCRMGRVGDGVLDGWQGIRRLMRW